MKSVEVWKAKKTTRIVHQHVQNKASTATRIRIEVPWNFKIEECGVTAEEEKSGVINFTKENEERCRSGSRGTKSKMIRRIQNLRRRAVLKEDDNNRCFTLARTTKD